MVNLLVIGAGGFLGAVARYGLSNLVQRFSRGAFPLGTFAVNVLGCLAIGALLALVEARPTLSPNVRLFLVIGLLGSFTTFSTFGNETYGLLRSGAAATALVYLGASVVLGLIAVGLGRAMIRLLPL